MLPHWPGAAPRRRGVGVGDAYADAQTVVQSHGQVDMTTLAALSRLNPDTVQAQATQAYNSVSSTVQSQWKQASSLQANAQRVTAGLNAAEGLLSKGYDPSNDADNQALITAIAGGVSLIPGIGPILGGAIMLLDAIGEGIAKALEAVGLIWYGCRSSGNWTMPNVLAAMLKGQQVMAQNPGSPGALFLPFLAGNYQKILNCQPAMTNLQAITAAAAMWNAGAYGNPVGIYIPALYSDTSDVFAVTDQIPFAFRLMDSTDEIPDGDATQASYGNMPFQGAQYYGQVQAPFILKLNGGSYRAPSSAPQATGNVMALQTASVTSAGVSTGTKVAAGAALTVGAVLAGSAGYAAATHQAFGAVWANIWRKVKSLGR